MTKRIILSEIAQIFDPLGLVCPIIVRAKIILQQLWQLRLEWDESVSQELHSQWLQFRTDIQHVHEIRISRSARIEFSDRVELHGFADASERAYGACTYLRTLSRSGEWKARLLCTKSRVAPLKSVSLPRLELCGALLLAQLADKVKAALEFSIIKERYYSYSTIVIAWIQAPSNRWKTFVANRVAEIQRLTPADCWNHVASEDNPADLLSRGISSSLLASSFLWWSGPEALKGERVQ